MKFKALITSTLILFAANLFAQDSLLCKDIDRNVDDITGEVKFSTPLTTGDPGHYKFLPISIIKYIRKGKTIYYLSLTTHGPTPVVDGKGVTILFADGSKWIKQDKIDVDADSDGYKYSAFITLSPADLLLFSNKKISKFRLYIFDEEVEADESDHLPEYAKCIKTAK